MQYWNVHCNNEIFNELLKCTMKYLSFYYNNEMKAAIIQWCIEIYNKTMKYTSIVKCNNTAQNFLCRI